MTTVYIDNNCAQATNLLNYISTFPFVTVAEEPKKKMFEENPLYNDLNAAFAEVRLMMDGKKKGKSLDELIAELEQEQEYEEAIHNGAY